MIKETRAWTPLGGSTLPLDSNGWPLADAQIVVFDERVNQSFNGPDPNAVQPNIGGTYHLSFQGQASLSPDWLQNYTVVNQVYNAATNTTTADLNVVHNSLAMLYIDFTNTVNPASSTGAGVSNVKLIQPGYSANTTQLFTNAMVNALTPFSTVRYLNIDQANAYGPTLDSNGKLIPLDWSQRKLPSSASQTSGAGAPGEAWEYMVALANATNTDLWINIPGPATDNYVTQLANLIKKGDTVNGVTYAGLNPNLKVNIELSNEVWGGIYQPYAYNLEAAKEQVAAGNSTLNNDGSTDPNVWTSRYYLERSMQVTNIFRSVFGPDPTYTKVRPMLGWQEGYSNYFKWNFPWFEANYGAPNKFFYGMGNANYATATDYSSVDNLISSLYATLPGEYATEAQFTVVANYYGLQNVSYEGGPGTGGAASTAQGQVALAANRDPRMEDFINQEYSTLYAAGGGLANIYDGPFDNYGPYNQYATAEVAQANNPTASPKYRGLVDLSQEAPVAPTVGTKVSASGVTPIPTNADSFGTSYTLPYEGQVNYWLLNVAAAGSYTLTLQTGGVATGQYAVSLGDTNKVGSYALATGNKPNVTTLALHAGLNTLAITTLGQYAVSSLTLTAPSSASPAPPSGGVSVADPGFEAVPLPASGIAYDPAGSPWTFAERAGLTGNNTGFTSGTPNAPQGQQVAFLQNLGTISQAIANWAAGNYAIGFQIAQRGNYGNSAQTVQVLVDGVLVGTFSPSSTSYQAVSTASFAVAAGTHTITIRGTNNNGDNTAFIDAVAVSPSPAPPSGGVSVADPGFEAVPLPASGIAYDPAGSPWTFAERAGLTGNNTGFTSGTPNAPQGQQVAFLQNLGTISQAIANWAAGNYAIGFQIAQRGNYGNSAQTVQVLVDGVLVGTFSPSSTSYQAVSTASFAVAAGTHTITIRGTNNNGDNTAFIDAVSISHQ